jgi:hypothetical protein
MRRRESITLFGAIFAFPLAATAQEPGRTYRLGLLKPIARDTPVIRAFLSELRPRGFIEGLRSASALLETRQ